MINDDILKSFKGRKVLVTGGTGLIGRQIATMLCDAGATVQTVSLDDIHIDSRMAHIIGDLSSFEFCKKLTTDVDFVFHIAGIKGSIAVTQTKPASFFVPLLMMNTNILEACRINKVKKVVYTSSVGAYASAEIFKEGENEDGPPMDAFPGMAKRIAEQQIQAYKIQYHLDNFSVVRPANVFGPGDNFDPDNAMVIPSLMHRIHKGEDPVRIWGDGTAIRDFVYSRDVAEGVILALYYGTNSKYVNLGSGIGYSIKELVEALHSFLNFNYKFDTSKPSGFPRRIMDISLAKESIGYYPTTFLLDGLKATWEWYIHNQEEHLNKKNYFSENKDES